jgi:hypothetical protein
MTTDLKAQILEALDEAFHAIMRSGPVVRSHPEIVLIHKSALDKCADILTILQDPNVFVGKWEPADVEALENEIVIYCNKSVVGMPMTGIGGITAALNYLQMRGLLTPPTKGDEMKYDDTPAFPCTKQSFAIPHDMPKEWRDKIHSFETPHSGVTIRDYMAGKALVGLLSSETFSNSAPDTVAWGAYRQADAMMKARKE